MNNVAQIVMIMLNKNDNVYDNTERMCCMLLMTMMVRISNLVYEVVGGREEGHMDDNDDDL